MGPTDVRTLSCLCMCLAYGLHVGKQDNLQPGYRVVINDGPNACASCHVLNIYFL